MLHYIKQGYEYIKCIISFCIWGTKQPICKYIVSIKKKKKHEKSS